MQSATLHHNHRDSFQAAFVKVLSQIEHDLKIPGAAVTWLNTYCHQFFSDLSFANSERKCQAAPETGQCSLADRLQR